MNLELSLVKKLRTIKRSLWVSLLLTRAAMELVLFIGFQAKSSKAARGHWLKRTAQGLLGAMGVKVSVQGPPPTGGLLVSNHLGYLDILVLASVAPVVFVSKAEVRRWPVFGWLAKCAGTIFIKRESRADVVRAGDEIEQMLECGAVVVLFPEGTSSDGRSVLPFRSSLLEPVLRHKHPVSIAALDYRLNDGSVEQEVCYWGDMVLGAHLLNLLSKEKIQAGVRFGVPTIGACADRKELAKALRDSVSRLRRSATAMSAFE